jgi:signal transduction histidine kinase
VGLRSKIALRLTLLVVPFAVAMGLVQERYQTASLERATVEALQARMEARGQERCEALAERRGRGRGRWRGGRRHTTVRYAADFTPSQRGAPPLDADLRRALEGGADVASKRITWRGQRALLVAVRMPWADGPCAIVTVRRTAPGTGWWTTLAFPLAVSLAAVLIAVFAAGPAVRRIRLLTERVRRIRDEPEVPIRIGGQDEVAELAEEMDRSRRRDRVQMEALRQRDEALTDYVANTTHDLMLPITVLQGHLVSLRRQLEGGPGVADHLLDASLEESHHLASIVQNLSAAAKLEAGEPHLEFHPVELGGIVGRVAGRHAPIASQKGVALDHSVPPDPVHVRGDTTLLEQALSNLVHNAVRYNASGGHVAVVLEVPSRGAFRIRVLDDGPGIPPEELARVTERRFRGGAARSRHPHGLGLGLHIVRDVMERHGFELTFRNRDEGGLEVEVRGDAEP